jgi:hypothetical protein
MKGDITSRPTVIVEVPRAMNGRIVGMSGSFTDREWPISRTPFLFGRIETSDVKIESENGSRRHAEIHSAGPYYTIVDLSSNGTMINGVRIAKDAVHPLRHGDTITICASNFLFVQVAVTETHSESAKPDDAPEPTGVFEVGALVGTGNQNVGRPADDLNIGRAPDEIPSLMAMDALAHVASVEEQAARLRAEAELARARAETESARQESRRIRASLEDQDESRATLETELARMRQKIEEEVRARAEAEALARVQAEAQARAQAQAAEVELRNQLEGQRQELERLRAESRRFSVPAAESSTVAESSTPVETMSVPVLTDARPTGNPLPEGGKKTAGSSLKTRDSLPSTPEKAAYHFNLDDHVILVLSDDNLRGETLCTPAHLTSIGQDGRLTLSCVDSVSLFWLNKTVRVGKNPDRGGLLTAEARVLSVTEDASHAVVLSNTAGPLRSVQLRSSVRQLAIPELQTFARADGKPAELVDYSIGGVAIAVEKSEPYARGDMIDGTLRLKRTLVFDVMLEVRGRHPSPQRDDRDILNCRFSMREMDAEVLRAISMAVLYRR